MMPEKMFQQLLALGEAWQVPQMNYLEKDQRIEIRVTATPVLWRQEKCPHCARAEVRGYDHAPERRWRHLNVCQLQGGDRVRAAAWRGSRLPEDLHRARAV